MTEELLSSRLHKISPLVLKEAAYAEEVGESFHSSWNKNNRVVYSDEIEELAYSIFGEEENVHLYRPVCKRKTSEDDEAWDARESLLFSLIKVGNSLLEYHSIISPLIRITLY